MVSAATVLTSALSLTQELRTLLAREPSVCFAYLYGSHMLGLARPDSDIDVAVYFASAQAAEEDEKLKEELASALNAQVEILNLNQKWAEEFFLKVLPRAIVLKDAPERLVWERTRNVMSEEPGSREDYLIFELESMREKSALLREELPALDMIDMTQVRSGDKDAIRHFLGTFFMTFQPLETLVRRMVNYIHITTHQETLPKLREQIYFLFLQVGMAAEDAAPLDKMVLVRNKVAHAYWNLSHEELNNQDLRAARKVLDELTQRIEQFVSARLPNRQLK